MRDFSSAFFRILCFLVIGLMSVAGPAAVAEEDPLLQVQVFPDQSSVKVGMMFLVRVQVTNSSSDTSVEFWSNSCSYEKHWVADNPVVSIQSWTCNENTLQQVTLDPGQSYEKNIILYVPKQDATGPVTFRLGFKRMSEDGDVAEPLWSDPLTMNVTVPEEIKPVTTSSVSETTFKMPDQPAVDATPKTDSTASATPGQIPASTIPSLVFRDPGVPVEVLPGEEFSIALASNLSTGFRWKMTLPKDDPTVQFLGSEHKISDQVMPGVPGEEVYKFKAVTPGEVKADFVYERPWEARTAPTRKIFTILVQKN